MLSQINFNGLGSYFVRFMDEQKSNPSFDVDQYGVYI